jgi:hypothetical protein
MLRSREGVTAMSGREVLSRFLRHKKLMLHSLAVLPFLNVVGIGTACDTTIE